MLEDRVRISGCHTWRSTPTNSVPEYPATGVPLARFGIKGTQFVVKEFKDGDLTMYPAIAMTSGEARHYANPNAAARLEQARAAANKGSTRPYRLASQYD